MTSGNQQEPVIVDELQDQENVLKQCVEQLESAEATRATLISQLKEALQDQVWFHFYYAINCSPVIMIKVAYL